VIRQQKRGEVMKERIVKVSIRVCLVFFLLALFTGCFQRTKAPYVIERFTFDYPSPTLSGLAPVDEFIRIERFSVAQTFNTTAMVFKPQLYRFGSYQYSRWGLNPADMTGDFLARDFRKTGLVKGVFSYHDDASVRFVLEGVIEEFFESDDGSGASAIFVINIMLLDMREKELARRLCFQKTYRYVKPLDEKSPEGFAKGMSSDMALFSEQLIRDLVSTLQKQGK
jgi:ABC-type uncharacterized transport system auxiliary subunit